MIRIPPLVVATLLGLASVSPAFAFAVSTAAPGTRGGAAPADPDEALSGLSKNLVGATESVVRQTPALRGATVTYALSKVGRNAKPRDGLADLTAHPGDPSFNPFMGARSQDNAASLAH